MSILKFRQKIIGIVTAGLKYPTQRVDFISTYDLPYLLEVLTDIFQRNDFPIAVYKGKFASLEELDKKTGIFNSTNNSNIDPNILVDKILRCSQHSVWFLVGMASCLHRPDLNANVQSIVEQRKNSSTIVFFIDEDKNRAQIPSYINIQTVEFPYPDRNEQYFLIKKEFPQLRQDEQKELSESIRGLPWTKSKMNIQVAFSTHGEQNFQKILCELEEDKINLLKKEVEIKIIDVKKEFMPFGIQGILDYLTINKKSICTNADDIKKSIVLVGPPGNGKSQAAKGIAKHLGFSKMIDFDPGDLLSKYIGDTEDKLRRALATMEAISPTVARIEELEKKFTSAAQNNSCDSGVSQRLYANLLTWLQEHNSPIFFVNTCNSLDLNLIEPLVRKGRCDAIFFVPQPSDVTRFYIIASVLKKYGVNDINVQELVKQTKGFSGAECTYIVTDAYALAQTRGESISMEHIIEKIKIVQGQMEDREDRYKPFIKWATRNCMMADKPLL